MYSNSSDNSNVCSYAVFSGASAVAENYCISSISITPHCCICSGTCMHVGGVSYCQAHQPGGAVLPNISLPPPINIPSTVFDIKQKCQICEEDLEFFHPSQICESCKETIKVFKEMLDVPGKLHRQKQKKKRKKK